MSAAPCCAATVTYSARPAAGHSVKGAWAVLAAVGLVCVAWAASRQNHPAARVLAGAFCGLGALGAVNLLGSYTGVTLALNYAAAYASVVLGAPGVITLLVLRAVLGLA